MDAAHKPEFLKPEEPHATKKGTGHVTSHFFSLTQIWGIGHL
jgi:hypothetical protein